MALACVALLLGLAHLLNAKPLDCEPLVPETLDNATISKVLGKWFYIAGASQYKPHQKEMEALKNAYYFFYPGKHEDELQVTQVMRFNETCIVDKDSYITIDRSNSTMTMKGPHEDGTAQLLKSNFEDSLIMYHIQNTEQGISLSARSQNVSKEQLEEVKAQAACLGFTKDDMYYTIAEAICPLEGDDGDKKHPSKEEPTAG
ncbi:PREDICTED: alpha-1-acid glycoprotein 1-like isoform X2 [Gavialis gangeticus]|uniref:alpha-1-acid glycoprotein 1-like isoform X2 n=1 Tax=Gavialis gangeticus TaxID=94835 RepID=UPI00092E9D7E|nr:PREDICTED: alpha-1-acid glycoprotein 1-like isoform X2 [Gavialis gangeticus]